MFEPFRIIFTDLVVKFLNTFFFKIIPIFYINFQYTFIFLHFYFLIKRDWR